MYNSSKILKKNDIINNLYNKYKLHIFILQLKCYKYNFYNNWNIWIHDVNNNDWDIKSYKQIYKITNFIDFWKLYNNFPNLNNHIFFIMKNDIKPIYEDINNIKGGFYSLKIHQDNVFYIWKNLSIDLVTCNLEENKYNIINGLSIIKKKNFFIIKIWICNKKYNNLKYINLTNSIYKKYISNIKFTNFL
tara:strand:+ start:3389 stop:3958 length:570 start_codon:yes stop_codon:yes gene_type:complete